MSTHAPEEHPMNDLTDRIRQALEADAAFDGMTEALANVDPRYQQEA